MRRVLVLLVSLMAMIPFIRLDAVFAVALHPSEGDYLLYGQSWKDNEPQIVNYTFSHYLSSELVNVTVSCENWTALGFSTPPNNEGYAVVNVTDGRVTDQLPSNLFGMGELAYFWFLLFNWSIQDNHITIGSISFPITGEVNISRGGQQHVCWNISSAIGVSILFGKESGILFETESKQSGNEWTIYLLEGKVNSYQIIPELPTFLILLLFMTVTMLIAAVYKREKLSTVE